MRSLAGVASLAPEHMTARDVAFMLAPRLNAAARLDREQISLSLLRSPDCDAAGPLARELETLNARRRQLTEEAFDEACRLLEDHPFGGRSRNEIRPGLRSVVASPHVVFYRVTNDVAEIVRVLDGRRDLDEVFARDAGGE